jgi:hypothetical protein
MNADFSEISGFSFYLFKFVYNKYMKGFHCDISTHAYNVL